MSVKVEIMAGGKPVPPLPELIPEGLEFGEYNENYVLKPASGGDSVIVFDPERICRGICVERSKDGVFLGLSNVTGPSEIRLFYDLVRRVCGMLGTTVFSREDDIVSLGQTERFTEEDVDSAKAGLAVMTQRLENGGEKTVTIFGALNPITLDAAALKRMDGDPEKLEETLHELQSADAYYAAPRIYQDPKDGSLVGLYAVSCGIPTIMPYEPEAPFYLQEKVGRWVVYIFISDEEYGYVDFPAFVAGTEDLGPYDAGHFFCRMDLQTARKLIQEHPAEM